MAKQCKKKLMSLESQRIVSVLDECVHKMDLLSFLPLEFVPIEGVALVLGGNACCSLEEHGRLCNMYSAIQKLDTKTRAMQEASVVQDIQNSLLDFLRIVRSGETPVEGAGAGAGAGSVEGALHGVRPNVVEERGAVRKVGELLRELRGILLDRLLTTPTEERENKWRAQEASSSHRSNLELIGELEKEVAAAQQERDEDVRLERKNEVIKGMESSIEQMEKDSEDYVTKTQMDALEEHLSDQKNLEEKCSPLQQEVDQLQAKLSNFMAKNREEQGALRKKNFKVEAEIQNWIEKYDEDMEKKQAKLENMEQVYEQKKAELCQLQHHYGKLEQECSQIMEERQRAQELREQQEKELAIKTRATIIIQAFWKGWRFRQAMKTKTKTKNKKSKKGKRKK